MGYLRDKMFKTEYCKYFNKRTKMCKEYICDCRLWGTPNEFCAGFVPEKKKEGISHPKAEAMGIRNARFI